MLPITPRDKIKRVFKPFKHHQKRKASLNIDKDIKVTTDPNIKQPLIIIK